MKAVIQIESNNEIVKKEINVGEKITIGRSSHNDWVINDSKVSSTHSMLTFHADFLEVLDLKSKNGTFLNSIKIERSELFLGDVITIGKTVLRLIKENQDNQTSTVLEFPGRHYSRINEQLKINFTEHQVHNQSEMTSSPILNQIYHDRSHVSEVLIRKKINSTIKLSKDEIRMEHKGLSILAWTVDILLFFISTSIPVYVNQNFIKNQNLLTLFLFESIFLSFFILLNYKISDFSVGERFAGIKDLYIKQ